MSQSDRRTQQLTNVLHAHGDKSTQAGEGTSIHLKVHCGRTQTGWLTITEQELTTLIYELHKGTQ